MLEALAAEAPRTPAFAAKVDASVERVLDAQGADGPAALLHGDADRALTDPERPLRTPGPDSRTSPLRGERAGQAWTTVTGIEESAGSDEVARAPAP